MNFLDVAAFLALTPKLFTGLAVVGVGVTVYFAVKETKNAAVCKEELVLGKRFNMIENL